MGGTAAQRAGSEPKVAPESVEFGTAQGSTGPDQTGPSSNPLSFTFRPIAPILLHTPALASSPAPLEQELREPLTEKVPETPHPDFGPPEAASSFPEALLKQKDHLLFEARPETPGKEKKESTVQANPSNVLQVLVLRG